MLVERELLRKQRDWLVERPCPESDGLVSMLDEMLDRMAGPQNAAVWTVTERLVLPDDEPAGQQEEQEVECEACGELYSIRRLRLGYRTCLECGQKNAELEMRRRSWRAVPAYNKGPYVPIMSAEDLSDIFKSGERV